MRSAESLLSYVESEENFIYDLAGKCTRADMLKESVGEIKDAFPGALFSVYRRTPRCVPTVVRQNYVHFTVALRQEHPNSYQGTGRAVSHTSRVHI